MITEGGPNRGFSQIMPSFKEALTSAQIDDVIIFLRSLCRNPHWPRGELNLPRVMLIGANERHVVPGDVSAQEPKMAYELERGAATKLKGMGVKIVPDVDKAGFQKIADPYLDKLARELGPHADKVKTLIRSVN